MSRTVQWRRLFGVLTASLVGCASFPSLARGDEPRPSFVANKKPMLDAGDKTEGVYPTGIPLFNYDTNTGVGIGAGGFLFFNGTKKDPLFAYAPYQHSFFLQVFATTGGYQQHKLTYDGIFIANTPLRIALSVAFERNTNANYYGVGESTLKRITFNHRSYTRMADEITASNALSSNGLTSPHYDHYDSVKPSLSAGLGYDFLGGLLRAHYGFVMSHVGVSLYDGKPVEVAGARGATVRAIEGRSRLGMDCADKSSGVIGCQGGWDNFLKAGLTFDTRDFAPDPNSGVFIDATGEWADRAFGSSNDYVRLTTSARFFWSPAPKKTDLVLAARLMYSIASSKTPFFALDSLATSEQDQEGLGGENTLRGFRQDRFIGHVLALTNIEVRWTFWKFHLARQLFSLQAAPFFDVGRVFDKVDLSLLHWQPDGGGGLHIGWNQSTIVRFDAGFSREDYGLYIDFGMPF